MITLFTSEVINGVLSYVQYIKYSNGKEIKRVLDKEGIPTEIIDLKTNSNGNT